MENTALRETILAQYANSPRLLALITTFHQAASLDTLISTFLDKVWNPLTATGWGLDVWGRIVGVERVVKVAQQHYIGFKEADDTTGTARPLNDGIFYHGLPLTSNQRLTDEGFRKFIFAKAAANISNGAIADINRLLMILFGDKGHIYLLEGTQDYLGFTEQSSASHPLQTFNHGIFWSDTSLGPGDMLMVICHDWELSPLEATIIQSGILPRPSGVAIAYQRV